MLNQQFFKFIFTEQYLCKQLACEYKKSSAIAGRLRDLKAYQRLLKCTWKWQPRLKLPSKCTSSFAALRAVKSVKITLNSHFASNAVFRVESFSVDALVLRHDGFKIDGYVYTVSGKRCRLAHSLISGHKGSYAIADIRRGSLVRWCQMRVRSSKMRIFSFDRYIFPVKFPAGFTYRNFTRLRAVSLR